MVARLQRGERLGWPKYGRFVGAGLGVGSTLGDRGGPKKKILDGAWNVRGGAQDKGCGFGR